MKLPEMPDLKPSVPMKAIFWARIAPMKLKGTIWLDEKISEELKSIELDKSELQHYFAAKAKEEKEKKVVKKKEVVTLIDPKKAQNSAIVLGSMRLPNEKIKNAILLMDEKALNGEMIAALKDIAPTADEMTSVMEYEGDVDNLGPTEQFYRAISSIPRFDERMTSWLLSLQLPGAVTNILPGKNFFFNILF